MVTSQIKNEYWLKNVDFVFWQQKNFFTIKNYQLILATNLLTSLWSARLSVFGMGWKNLEEREGKGWEALTVSLLSPRDFFTLSPNRQPDHRLPFNTLFKPMLLYTSEVWGTYDKRNFDKWDQDPVERLHCQFYKCFLGLNKRASNVVARNDKPTNNLLEYPQVSATSRRTTRE